MTHGRVTTAMKSETQKKRDRFCAYLDHGAPFIDDVTSQLHATLAPDLVALVHDLDEDEPDAANDAGRHQNENARHVLEAERGRRLLVVLALLPTAALDPALVQVFHESACGCAETTRYHALQMRFKRTRHGDTAYARESRARRA